MAFSSKGYLIAMAANRDTANLYQCILVPPRPQTLPPIRALEMSNALLATLVNCVCLIKNL